jgi:membrane-bound serine protease (ClpP class)
MMLIDTESPMEAAIEISMGVIITTVVVITALFVLLAYLVVKAHKRRAMGGESGMIGEIGEVFSDIVGGIGSVKVMGEIWKAESSEDIPKGGKIKVLKVHDLTLKVQKA